MKKILIIQNQEASIIPKLAFQFERHFPQIEDSKFLEKD